MARARCSTSTLVIEPCIEPCKEPQWQRGLSEASTAPSPPGSPLGEGEAAARCPGADGGCTDPRRERGGGEGRRLGCSATGAGPSAEDREPAQAQGGASWLTPVFLAVAAVLALLSAASSIGIHLPPDVSAALLGYAILVNLLGQVLQNSALSFLAALVLLPCYASAVAASLALQAPAY